MISQPPSAAPCLSDADSAGVRRRCWLALAGIVAVYFAFRLPFVLEQLPGQDEAQFSVPGLTIAREGIPRIPYYPARDPAAFFYRADEVLLEMPPGLFYLQAPFFLVLPESVATSRLPSLLAGAVSIVLVFLIGTRGFGQRAGLWGAGLYAISRILFFTATFARPDQCCAAFGLAALVVLWDGIERQSRRRIVLAGVLLGAGLLCHPFAIVFCLLCGLWVLASPGDVQRRVTDATLLTLPALATFALWLPLILPHRDLFQKQFFNTMNLTGPGLMTRLAWPWPYLPHQIRLLWEQAGAWQFLAMLAGLAGATVVATGRQDRSARRLVALTWGSIYLLTACQGLHPTKGYWSFTGALVLCCLGFVGVELMLRLRATSGFARFLAVAVPVGLLSAFVPESGLRMWWHHVRFDSQGRYDGREFTRRMLADLPREGRFVVEPAFIFDVWNSGRDAIERVDEQDYLIDRYDYDWLLVSRDGLDKQIPRRLSGRLVRTFGDRDDPLACYAELYEPADAR